MKEFFFKPREFSSAWGEVPPNLLDIPGDVLLNPSCDSRNLAQRSAQLLASPEIHKIIGMAVRRGQDVVLDVTADAGTRLLIGRGIAQNGFGEKGNRHTVIDHRFIKTIKRQTFG